MSFIFKTAELDTQYKKILKTQKELIKTNKYMRELEEKYNKSKKKYSNLYIYKRPTDGITTHNWPIESGIFTKVLKSKLDTELNSSRKNYFKSPSRSSISKKKSSPSNLSSLKLKPLEVRNLTSLSIDKSLENIMILSNQKLTKMQSTDSPLPKASPDPSTYHSLSPSLKKSHNSRLSRLF